VTVLAPGRAPETAAHRAAFPVWPPNRPAPCWPDGRWWAAQGAAPAAGLGESAEQRYI